MDLLPILIQVAGVVIALKLIGDFVVRMKHGHPPPKPKEDPVAQRIRAVPQMGNSYRASIINNILKLAERESKGEKSD